MPSTSAAAGAGSPPPPSPPAVHALAARTLAQISESMLRVPLADVDALMDAVFDAGGAASASPRELLEAALEVQAERAGRAPGAVDRSAAALSLLALRLLRARIASGGSGASAPGPDRALALRCLSAAWLPAVSAPPSEAWPAALLRGGFAALCELGGTELVPAIGERALCHLVVRRLQGSARSETDDRGEGEGDGGAARSRERGNGESSGSGEEGGAGGAGGAGGSGAPSAPTGDRGLSASDPRLPECVESALAAAPPAALLAVASVAISVAGETAAAGRPSPPPASRRPQPSFLPPLALLLAVGSRGDRVEAGKALVPALARARLAAARSETGADAAPTEESQADPDGANLRAFLRWLFVLGTRLAGGEDGVAAVESAEKELGWRSAGEAASTPEGADTPAPPPFGPVLLARYVPTAPGSQVFLPGRGVGLALLAQALDLQEQSARVVGKRGAADADIPVGAASEASSPGDGAAGTLSRVGRAAPPSLPTAEAAADGGARGSTLPPLTRSVLRTCLTDPDQLTRRRAADLLRRADLPPVRGGDRESTRDAYFRALEILDEYGMHLVQEQWRETLQELHEAAEEGGTAVEGGGAGERLGAAAPAAGGPLPGAAAPTASAPAAGETLPGAAAPAVAAPATAGEPLPGAAAPTVAAPAAAASPLRVPFAWMEPAWERGMTHDNTQARKAVLLTFFDRRWSPSALLEVPAAFVAGTLVPTLADPGVRRGEHSERIARESREWIRILVEAHAVGGERDPLGRAAVAPPPSSPARGRAASASSSPTLSLPLPTASLAYVDVLLEEALALLRAPELPQSVAESARFIAELTAEKLEQGLQRQRPSRGAAQDPALAQHLLARIRDVAAAAEGQKAAGQAGNDPEAVRPLLRAAAALARAARAHEELRPTTAPASTLPLLAAIEPILALTPGFALAPGGALEREADALARAAAGGSAAAAALSALRAPTEVAAVERLIGQIGGRGEDDGGERVSALPGDSTAGPAGADDASSADLALSLAVWEMRKRANARAKLALLAAGGRDAGEETQTSVRWRSGGIEAVRTLADGGRTGPATGGVDGGPERCGASPAHPGTSLRVLIERCAARPGAEAAVSRSATDPPASLLWALDVWGAALEALVPVDWPGRDARGLVASAPASRPSPTALARLAVLREVRDAVASPSFFDFAGERDDDERAGPRTPQGRADTDAAPNAAPCAAPGPVSGSVSPASSSCPLAAPLFLARLRIAAASVVLLASATGAETAGAAQDGGEAVPPAREAVPPAREAVPPAREAVPPAREAVPSSPSLLDATLRLVESGFAALEKGSEGIAGGKGGDEAGSLPVLLAAPSPLASATAQAELLAAAANVLASAARVARSLARRADAAATEKRPARASLASGLAARAASAGRLAVALSTAVERARGAEGGTKGKKKGKKGSSSEREEALRSLAAVEGIAKRLGCSVRELTDGRASKAEGAVAGRAERTEVPTASAVERAGGEGAVFAAPSPPPPPSPSSPPSPPPFISALPAPLAAALSTTPLVSRSIDESIRRTRALEAVQRVSLAAWKAADAALRVAEALRGGTTANDERIATTPPSSLPTASSSSSSSSSSTLPARSSPLARLHADALRALAAVPPENALPSILSVLRATRLGAIEAAKAAEAEGASSASPAGRDDSPASSLVADLYDEAWTSASRAFSACKRRRTGLCAAFVAAVVPPEAFDPATSAPGVLAVGGPIDQAVRKLLVAGRRVPKLAALAALQLTACLDQRPEALAASVGGRDAQPASGPPASPLLSLLEALVLFGPEDFSLTPAEDFALDAAECEQMLLVRRPVEGDAATDAALEQARGADCAPRVAVVALFAHWAGAARSGIEAWVEASGAGSEENEASGAGSEENEASRAGSETVEGRGADGGASGATACPAASASSISLPSADSVEQRCALLAYDALMYAALTDPELSSPVYRFRGETHRRKARLWQALSALAPAAALRDPGRVLRDALGALTVQNAADVKQYQERIAEAGIMGVGVVAAASGGERGGPQRDGEDDPLAPSTSAAPLGAPLVPSASAAPLDVSRGRAAEDDAVRTQLLAMLDAYDNSKRCELSSVMVLVTRAALRDQRRRRRRGERRGRSGGAIAGAGEDGDDVFSLCLDSLVPWCSCHVHQARVFAQLGLWRLAETQPRSRLSRPVHLLLRFFQTNADVRKLRSCLRRGSAGEESAFDADLDLSLSGVFAVARGAEDGRGFEACPETLGDEITAFLLQERTRLRGDMRRRDDEGSKVEHAQRGGEAGDRSAASAAGAVALAAAAQQPQRQRKIAPGEEAAGDDAWTAALGVQALARARRGDWEDDQAARRAKGGKGAEGEEKTKTMTKRTKRSGGEESEKGLVDASAVETLPSGLAPPAFPHSMESEADPDSTWVADDRLVDCVTRLPTRFSAEAEAAAGADAGGAAGAASSGMEAVEAYLSGRLLFAPPRRCLWAEDEAEARGLAGGSLDFGPAGLSSCVEKPPALPSPSASASPASGAGLALRSRSLPSWSQAPSLSFLRRALAPPRPTRRPRRTDLVVVASLVDKVPNLAGLARTCEVFGARCLVVPSLACLADRSFAAVSVTAERWLDVRAVAPADLAPWLAARKAEGWRVAGVEQCERSVSLEDARWAQRTILVLGAEKLGIPQSVLDLVDSAVEIPQLGVVRSLNVHVAGSIAIAAYTMHVLDEVKTKNRAASETR